MFQDSFEQYKTVQVITKEEFESIAPETPPVANQEVPPPPPMPAPTAITTTDATGKIINPPKPLIHIHTSMKTPNFALKINLNIEMIY